MHVTTSITTLSTKWTFNARIESLKESYVINYDK